MKWSDRLAMYCGIYYCMCGLICLAIDVLTTGKLTAEDSIIESSAASVMRLLFPVGFLMSLIAYLGYPTMLKYRIAAAILPVFFALGAIFLWLPLYLARL
ncbi:MAG: hypothetical protein NT018_04405 [Armatimonadetes bacterium]|nr:hypothetical protein [Armatimonadota bacterium]